MGHIKAMGYKSSEKGLNDTKSSEKVLITIIHDKHNYTRSIFNIFTNSIKDTSREDILYINKGYKQGGYSLP